MKRNVLFVCIHNSGRSQIAEAFLRVRCGELLEAHSAGLEPGTLNPLVVDVMAELGIDISQAKTKSVFDALKSGTQFEYVITVCDESSAEFCPIFPGQTKRLHWSFADPSKVTGTHDEKVEQMRKIRDRISRHIEAWCDKVCALQH